MGKFGTFGEILGNLLQGCGETYRDVARAVGISPASLSSYRSGAINPSVSALEALADHFHTSTDYLLGRVDTASLDANEQAASELLGLSDDAMRALTRLKSVSINELLENDKFLSSVSLLDASISNYQQLLERKDLSAMTLDELAQCMKNFEAKEHEIAASNAHARKLILEAINQILDKLEDQREIIAAWSKLDEAYAHKRNAAERERQIRYYRQKLNELEAQQQQEVNTRGEHHEEDGQAGQSGL